MVVIDESLWEFVFQEFQKIVYWQKTPYLITF